MEDTADDAGARRGINGEAQVADGDGAVVGDANGGADAPDEAPPGTGWRGADGGVFLSECGLMGGMRGGADFAVNFGEVGVSDELLEHGVCGVDGVDGLGCE